MDKSYIWFKKHIDNDIHFAILQAKFQWSSDVDWCDLKLESLKNNLTLIKLKQIICFLDLQGQQTGTLMSVAGVVTDATLCLQWELSARFPAGCDSRQTHLLFFLHRLRCWRDQQLQQWVKSFLSVTNCLTSVLNQCSPVSYKWVRTARASFKMGCALKMMSICSLTEHFYKRSRPIRTCITQYNQTSQYIRQHTSVVNPYAQFRKQQ